MSYSLACGDVIPGCSATFDADTEDELMSLVAQHARTDHEITDITPEVETAVRSAVKVS